MLEDSYERGGGVQEVVIAHPGTSLFMFRVLWCVENKYYESPAFSCLRSATTPRNSFCIKIQYMCLQMTQNAVKIFHL
jgi:hypothetical protein